MFRVFVGLAVMALAGFATAQAQKPISETDRKFIHATAQSGMMEGQLGTLAVKQAGSQNVKDLGQMMIDDHNKVNQDLIQLARQKGIDVPQQLSSKHQKTVDHFSKLRGAEFDREYLKYATKDHERDIQDLRHEASNGSDADIRAFAQNHIAAFEQHLKMIQNVNSGKPMHQPQ